MRLQESSQTFWHQQVRPKGKGHGGSAVVLAEDAMDADVVEASGRPSRSARRRARAQANAEAPPSAVLPVARQAKPEVAPPWKDARARGPRARSGSRTPPFHAGAPLVIERNKFKDGDSVVVRLLGARPELNGRTAKIIAFDPATDRYAVKLDEMAGIGGETLKIREINLSASIFT